MKVLGNLPGVRLGPFWHFMKVLGLRGQLGGLCLPRLSRSGGVLCASCSGDLHGAGLRYAIDEHGVASALWKSRESSRAFPRAVWRINVTISR